MPAISERAALVDIPEPFPGLRPFEGDEEPIFRGRQRHTEELLRRLAMHRFLAVVGTSGSGRSSLVRAGLRPALDRGYLAGATSRWRIAMMRPGMAPIDNLANALRRAEALETADEGKLRSSRLGLVDTVRDAHLARGESLLVVADQFEEVFRFQRRMSEIDARGEAALFVNLLLTGASRPDAPIYVVLTMRSDFLGDCAQFPGLPEALTESQYLIPRLTREQRRQAIEEPLRLFGATMTPQLVEQLLNDSSAEVGDPATGAYYPAGAPDPLPVLQHALMRTYLEWNSIPTHKGDVRIDLDHYQMAGRMAKALDQHAEHVFAKELDDAGRHWAQRIFRCLTTTELGRPVRRPTPLADLYRVIGARQEDLDKIDKVLGVLQRRENSFLKVHVDTTVDITHESLIWKWKRLSDWVAEEAASAELYRDAIKDAKRKITWGEAKLSSALAARDRDAWNAPWGSQYSESQFDDVVAFLSSSRRAVRKRKLEFWVVASVLVCLVILAIVAYYSQALQKAREREATAVARDSLAKDLANRKQDLANRKKRETSLAGQIEGLNASGDPAIAVQKSDLETQLAESLEESQKLQQQLEGQVKQSTEDLLASVKSLQSRLNQAQRERDDAVQGRAAEFKQRQDAESKADHFEAMVISLTKEIENIRASISRPEPSIKENSEAPVASPRAGQTRVNSQDRLTYVWISPGEFTMGCSPGDKECVADEAPAHQVTITKGFWMGQTPVTQEAYQRIIGKNPSKFKGNRLLPVETVSWVEAQAYCQMVGMRLPTEAEWEYAARAHSVAARYGNLEDIAWYSNNSGGQTHEVGKKRRNALGLYDMLGNVWQWTADWHGNYHSGSQTDPSGAGSGRYRALRGGSWGVPSRYVRVSFRSRFGPDSRNSYFGFRCVGQ
jgi:formylglycine-generating enzyme required for sulfatase activity